MRDIGILPKIISKHSIHIFVFSILGKIKQWTKLTYWEFEPPFW